MSFTVNFSFYLDRPFFEGIPHETVVSNQIGAKYKVLVMHPEDGHMYSLKGLNEPLPWKKLNDGLKKIPPITADTFVFEVFDRDGNKIFDTAFDAKSKVPRGLSPMQTSFTSFCFAFDLPKSLKSSPVSNAILS